MSKRDKEQEWNQADADHDGELARMQDKAEGSRDSEPKLEIICACGNRYTLHLATVCPRCFRRPCPNPNCENGLIRGTKVGCSICAVERAQPEPVSPRTGTSPEPPPAEPRECAQRIAKLQHMGIERGLELRIETIENLIRSYFPSDERVRELVEAQANLAEAQKAAKIMICCYCGEVCQKPEPFTKETMVDEIVEHLKTCPTHPANAYFTAMDELRKAQDALRKIASECRDRIDGAEESRGIDTFLSSLIDITEIAASSLLESAPADVSGKDGE